MDMSSIILSFINFLDISLVNNILINYNFRLHLFLSIDIIMPSTRNRRDPKLPLQSDFVINLPRLKKANNFYALSAIQERFEGTSVFTIECLCSSVFDGASDFSGEI